jgi:hypothetical protein
LPDYLPRLLYPGRDDRWSFEVVKENSEHETLSASRRFAVLLYLLVQ